MSLMRKVLQNRMALDHITTSQGGTCAFIQMECYMFLPNELASLLNHMRIQITPL